MRYPKGSMEACNWTLRAFNEHATTHDRIRISFRGSGQQVEYVHLTSLGNQDYIPSIFVRNVEDTIL